MPLRYQVSPTELFGTYVTCRPTAQGKNVRCWDTVVPMANTDAGKVGNPTPAVPLYSVASKFDQLIDG